MSSSIQLLSSDLRNKISAGEVVERPASVVKELIENSLDAGADRISIVIQEGGNQLIQVIDNGSGIPADDLQRAFERYSTSKISQVDDLFNIKTLGFRGEALASIASVSEVEIESSIDTIEGAALRIQGGMTGAVAPAPGVLGTTITVRNLFYNTPARKKFLKSTRVEGRHVMQSVRGFALAHPAAAFKLIVNNKELFNLQSEALEDRINSVFDPTYKTNLLAIDMVKGDYKISGFIGNLNLIRSRPSEQYLFLNGRIIKDRLLNSAVYSGYQSLTKRGEYPFFALNLRIPTDQIDVNVHPMKTEVRFKDEWRIYHVLKSSVEGSLQDILKTIPNISQEDPFFQRHQNQTISMNMSTPKDGERSGVRFQDHSDFGVQETHPNVEKAKSYASQLASRPDRIHGIDTQNIWQVHSKYIITQIESGLVIIDQHVAHERVLFEEAMAAFESQPMISQTLLFPESIEFAPDDHSVLLDLFPYLEKIGFRIKQNGKNKLKIEGIPSAMAWGNEKQVLTDIIDNYIANQKQYNSFQENLAASFACHAAVKAGDELTKEEMSELVDRLFGTKHPYYCPHGRPIIVQLSLEELDNRFERK